MLQIKDLFIIYNKDLRKLIENFNITINEGDKICLIGEEGNGKSTLLKWIYNPELIKDYCEASGKLIINHEKLAYLPQELSDIEKDKTIYEYFLEEEFFLDTNPKDLKNLSSSFGFDESIYYEDKKLNEVSGGELIKIELLRIMLSKASVLLLDEPSNDLDIDTLNFLESFINSFKGSILFISHDEVLLNNCANRVIHIELLKRKSVSRINISNTDYQTYINERENNFRIQKQKAISDIREEKIRQEKYNRVYQSVEHALRTVSRQDPGTARNLKDKMHTVKAMGKRFEKEKENMTEMPIQEEAIFIRFDDDISFPNNKILLDLKIPELKLGDRVLVKNIELYIKGPEKICIIGKNGIGKSTLLKEINEILKDRPEIKLFYMPQDYLEKLNTNMTPIDYLAPNKNKEEITIARNYLGAMRYTSDEMEHQIKHLSGGQKAKLFLLKMNLEKANVLLLDEPSRNFSPLSNPVIREVLKQFKGAIIAISHDRKFIDEVADTIYELNSNGLFKIDK